MTFTSEDFSKLKNKIDQVKVGMLTTMDGSNYLFSRPMTSQQLDEEGYLWFFSSDHSAVAQQLAQHTHVNVAFSDPGKSLYLSVSGHASVSGDRQKIEQLWNPLVAAWFPKGKDDPEVALIKVHVHAAEYWDSDSSKMMQLFSMIKAAIVGEQPKDIGEHGKISR